tara:strand:- start:58 stop:390 length:333 start_codon:yes stop_codon:yes gene_type:complete
MSEFFESEIVQDELNEINKMQEEIYGNMMSFAELDLDEKMEHIEQLTELLDKQKVMYTRLALSDDPQAIEMKEKLRQSVTMLGFPEGTDITVLFDSMRQTIESLKQNVDR